MSKEETTEKGKKQKIKKSHKDFNPYNIPIANN